MVVCPRCQAQLSDAYRYCPFCNSEIHPAEMKVAAEPQQVNPQTVELDTSVGQEATPSKNSDADMKTQKQKLFAIGTVIAIIIAIFMGSAISISQRTTYNSEDEMKMAVAGTYTCYDDDGTTHYQLKVENDTVVKRWNYLGSNSDVTLNISAWNPRKGSFEVSLGTIVVTSDGDLKLDGKLYEKGGYWSSTLDKKSYGGLSYNFNSPSYNYSSDNGYSDLKITAASLSSNSSYTIVPEV